MKKIIVSILVAFFVIPTTFGYNPTIKDTKTLKSLYTAIDILHQKSPERLELLYNDINTYLPSLKKDNKTKYLLSELGNYLETLIIDKHISEDITYEVIDIIDGDTIKIEYEGKIISVRLIGIDAPENSTTRFGYIDPLGDQAKAKLKELIGNNDIIIELDGTQGKYDIYNRLLAYIFVGDININQKMIETGYAKEYTYNKPYKYQKEFKEAQQIAQGNKIGIWGEEDFIEDNKTNNTNPTNNSNNNTTPNTRIYFTGPQGGCYYYNSNNNKTYVDRSYCK